MTDSGGNTAAVNANLTFDDAAGSTAADTGGVPTGTYKPSLGTVTGGGAIHPNNFNAPAPANPYSVLLSDLIGFLRRERGHCTSMTIRRPILVRSRMDGL